MTFPVSSPVNPQKSQALPNRFSTRIQSKLSCAFRHIIPWGRMQLFRNGMSSRTFPLPKCTSTLSPGRKPRRISSE